MQLALISTVTKSTCMLFLHFARGPRVFIIAVARSMFVATLIVLLLHDQFRRRF